MQNKERLLRIIDDPATSDSERREAQVELDALELHTTLTEAEKHAVTACGPLGPDLLHFANAQKIHEVTWRDLVQFTDAHDWPGKWGNKDVQHLWLGWVCWGNGGISFVADFRQQIWGEIKAKFATDEERRAEFERMDRAYPLFGLSAVDDPYELEMYERHLGSSDRNFMLAHARKVLDKVPEYAFRTREVAQRITAKLSERK